eukprot:gene26692-biopygen17160
MVSAQGKPLGSSGTRRNASEDTPCILANISWLQSKQLIPPCQTLNW